MHRRAADAQAEPDGADLGTRQRVSGWFGNEAGVGAIAAARSNCDLLKLETPIQRTFPSAFNSASACQPGRVVDRPGQTFYSDLTNRSGIHMAFVLDIARIDTRNAASIVTLTMDGASAVQKTHLADLKKKVRLIGAR